MRMVSPTIQRYKCQCSNSPMNGVLRAIFWNKWELEATEVQGEP